MEKFFSNLNLAISMPKMRGINGAAWLTSGGHGVDLMRVSVPG